MKNDMKDFIQTPLAYYFNFSTKSDPFLVVPSKEIEDIDNLDKIVLPIPNLLTNRVKAW